MTPQRLLLFALSLFVLCSCGDKGAATPDEPFYSEVGVWESGKHFISFSSDKFLSAYVADRFIDSGSYSRSKENVIVCQNPYFAKSTEYRITDLNDRTMKVDISYVDVLGNSKTTSLTLTKTDRTPAIKDHQLAGKVYTYYGALGSSNGNFTWDFTTYYSGKRTSDISNLKNYPISFYYIYIGNRIYLQRFTPVGKQTPTIGGWTNDVDNGVIQVREVEFNAAGLIYGLSNVTDSAL